MCCIVCCLHAQCSSVARTPHTDITARGHSYSRAHSVKKRKLRNIFSQFENRKAVDLKGYWTKIWILRKHWNLTNDALDSVRRVHSMYFWSDACAIGELWACGGCMLARVPRPQYHVCPSSTSSSSRCGKRPHAPCLMSSSRSHHVLSNTTAVPLLSLPTCYTAMCRGARFPSVCACVWTCFLLLPVSWVPFLSSVPYVVPFLWVLQWGCPSPRHRYYQHFQSASRQGTSLSISKMGGFPPALKEDALTGHCCSTAQGNWGKIVIFLRKEAGEERKRKCEHSWWELSKQQQGQWCRWKEAIGWKCGG